MTVRPEQRTVTLLRRLVEFSTRLDSSWRPIECVLCGARIDMQDNTHADECPVPAARRSLNMVSGPSAFEEQTG